MKEMKIGASQPSRTTIFIDESGTLPDVSDSVIVLAAVSAQSEILRQLRKIAKESRTHSKNPRSQNEIKFYSAGKRTKTFFLTKLASLDVQLFALVVEKEHQKIADTPENFALLLWVLLEDYFLFNTDSEPIIIIDKHFHRESDRMRFDTTVSELLGKKLQLQHVDSLEEPGINVADMVAGSLLWKRVGKDVSFAQLISIRMSSEHVIRWKELKKKVFTKKSR